VNKVTFPRPTHEIDILEKDAHPPEEVILHGYLGARTDLSKNFYFVSLLNKDLSHSIQIVSHARSKEGRQLPAHDLLKKHGPNTPVVIKGLLKVRDPTSNDRLGDLQKVKTQEVELWDVQALNEMPKDILMTPETAFPPEQRHLQIRQHKHLRDALKFRSKAARLCRKILEENHKFDEIETPLLFKSTAEGAREFLVPTRRRGLAYALPQSPQQFKQILMGSGITRYYQFARCFRDEDLRADRQPEFTQLDVEMSFAGGEDVMTVIESLVKKLWKELLEHDLPTEFPRMTYQEAMSKYGVDKPDIRYEMHLSRIDHLLPMDLVSKISPLAMPAVDAMVLRIGAAGDPARTRRFVGSFLDSPDARAFHDNPNGGPGIFIYDSSRPLQGLQPFGFAAAESIEELYEPEDGDLIVLQARQDKPYSGGSIHAGSLRIALHREAVKEGLLRPPKDWQPLWVTDFPLFSPIKDSEPGQGGRAGLASTHHPFTSPKSAEDVDLLATQPERVIGEHYDLVMDGIELGGGSRRIHNAEIQKHVMEHILKMTPERVADFVHLLEVLRAGCPPHAGIALGFDRLIAVMLGRQSIRDVIAFPKSGRGDDLLMKSPGEMTPEALKTYHLQLVTTS